LAQNGGIVVRDYNFQFIQKRVSNVPIQSDLALFVKRLLGLAEPTASLAWL